MSDFSDFKAKIHPIRPLDVFKGPTSKRTEVKVDGRGEKDEGKKGW